MIRFARRPLRFDADLPGIALVLLLAALAAPAGAQITPPISEPGPMPTAPAALAPLPDTTIEPARFDGGRMWTFDVPPADWFSEEYGIRADADWFARARLGSLRIPGCSASFVSPDGLVLTNHHCARDYVSAVSAEGEDLLENGFYAETRDEERPVEGFTADQLVEIRDVTDQIQGHVGNRTGDERARRLEEKRAEIEEDLLDDLEDEEGDHVVEVVELYDGGRYSAYVFRRWSDARLVLAPELDIGFFGGDADNFTYPRYNLDMALFRLYGDDGEPIASPDYFRWSLEGVGPGDPVFIVGNPGETNRQQTVAQLLFRRDVEDRGVLSFLERRAEVLEEFVEAFPAEADRFDVKNDWFGAENSVKSVTGALEGLRDPAILARKEAAERRLQAAIEADPALAEAYGGHVRSIADLQRSKRENPAGYGAFLGLTAEGFESPTLHRALLAFQVLNARQAGAPASALAGLLAQIDSVGDAPPVLDDLLIEARILDFLDHYSEDERWLRSILRGRTPEGAATTIREGSILSDSATAVEALRTGRLDGNDPAIRFVALYVNTFAEFQQTYSRLAAREEELMAGLGRARFALHGWDVPPDATSTPRIADGVVASYPYNGTVAPPFTTFWGLWDRNASFDVGTGGDDAWDLPERWRTPPAGMDLGTPLNFVASVDISGGNSGSPVLNAELELVGVVFDGNIESLPGDYIFLPERNRAITVDARGILEALEHAYRADRIVDEIRAAAGAAVTMPGLR